MRSFGLSVKQAFDRAAFRRGLHVSRHFRLHVTVLSMVALTKEMDVVLARIFETTEHWW